MHELCLSVLLGRKDREAVYLEEQETWRDVCRGEMGEITGSTCRESPTPCLSVCLSIFIYLYIYHLYLSSIYIIYHLFLSIIYL